MFVDLDWPLNASSLLSASAELLVIGRERTVPAGIPRCWRRSSVRHVRYRTEGYWRPNGATAHHPPPPWTSSAVVRHRMLLSQTRMSPTRTPVSPYVHSWRPLAVVQRYTSSSRHQAYQGLQTLQRPVSRASRSTSSATDASQLRGPRLWNSLPINLKQCRSLEQFKRLLHFCLVRECTAPCDILLKVRRI